MLPGHALIIGDSFTVTENEHVETAQLFVALQFTVVVPAANVDPDAGLQMMVGAGEPVEEGSVQVAVELSHCTMLPGHALITGDVFNVTLNEQFADPLMFAALQFTGVVPTANVDPDDGVQIRSGVGLPVIVAVHVATGLSHCEILDGHVIPGDAVCSPASNSPSEVRPVAVLEVDVMLPAAAVLQAVGIYFLTT